MNSEATIELAEAIVAETTSTARFEAPDDGQTTSALDDVGRENVDSEYDAWFEHIAGHRPWDWQRELAADASPRSRVVRIPTGYGKTLGVLMAWLRHRVVRGDERWPRRLVWVLPMRVLAEQTAEVARRCVERLGRLWNPATDHAGKVGVHVLMGGSAPDGEWNLFPEECAVLIGTQDMLLSRALNRGFAAPRARWPMEFGLLNHDALWVLDEVQLMDVGLATTAQLQAFFDDDSGRGGRPRLSFWMSATLQPEWLRSVDTAPRLDAWVSRPTELGPKERSEGLGAVRKRLALGTVPLGRPRDLAQRVVDEHATTPEGPYGRITLVVCNTVNRASELYAELAKLGAAREIRLIHGRYRPHERAGWKDAFLARAACHADVDRILVATQVVEAGVDISAGCVVTELAPWSSLVQRFGRCARYGGEGRVVVVDRGRDEKLALPYTPEELDGAWAALEALAKERGDAGIASLEAYEASLSIEQRAALYPYRPAHLLIRRELDELFDTTPDLTGADVDVSRYIRSGDDRDVSVFWIDVAAAAKGHERPSPASARRPTRDELCAVPVGLARDWLCGGATEKDPKPRLRGGVRAWVWDWIDGEWRVADRASLTPGAVVCVAADVGGYSIATGFDANVTAAVAPIAREVESTAQDEADDAQDAETLSAAAYKTIATHGGEVARIVDGIGHGLGLTPRLREILGLAGRWHDLGKAHPAFQGKIRADERPVREDLAKAPPGAWARGYPTRDGGDVRPGFRHELSRAVCGAPPLRAVASRAARAVGGAVPRDRGRTHSGGDRARERSDDDRARGAPLLRRRVRPARVPGA